MNKIYIAQSLSIDNLEITESDFQDYVMIDEELTTSEVPNEETIVVKIKDSQVASLNAESENSGQEEITEPPLSISQARGKAEKIQTFLESRGVDDNLFRTLSVVR